MMGDTTGISWTDHTFNPWWGCSRVSPACRFCYADRDASRYGFELWRRHGERRMLSENNWRKPLRWNREAEAEGVPAMVFCASMADVFEDHPQLHEPRERLWGLIEATPWLYWQLLTKRPENVAAMAPWGEHWPVNVWLGTSVETQRWADARIPVLLSVPARTRFLSAEPLLEAVDLSKWLGGTDDATTDAGRGRLPVGPAGRFDDRLAGARLAPGIATLESTVGHRDDDPVHATARGEVRRRVSASSGDGERCEGARTGSQAGLAALSRPDSRWLDDQSQERGEDGQPASEPGVGHIGGAGSSRSERVAPWAAESVRDAERDGETLRVRRSGDLCASGGRRTPAGDSGGLRSRVPDDREDRDRSASIAWLIVGGESGPKSRPMDIAWARTLIAQCGSAGVAVFMKQTGRVYAKANGFVRDPLKGGDPSEWPAGLDVRQFPLPAGRPLVEA